MPKQLKADLVLLFVTLSWGVSYLLVDICLTELGPLTLNALRFLLASLGAGLAALPKMRGMTRETLQPLADGRIYTASQAVANGLADAVGTEEDCLAALQQEIGEDCAVYDYYPTVEEESLFTLLRYLTGSTESRELESLLSLLPPSGVLAYYDGSY